jgi:hypothetical protein
MSTVESRLQKLENRVLELEKIVLPEPVRPKAIQGPSHVGTPTTPNKPDRGSFDD